MFGKRTTKVELVGGPNDGDVADAEVAPDNSILPIVIVKDRYVFWRYRWGKKPQMRLEIMNIDKLAAPVKPKRRRRRRKQCEDEG